MYSVTFQTSETSYEPLERPTFSNFQATFSVLRIVALSVKIKQKICFCDIFLTHFFADISIGKVFSSIIEAYTII